MELTEKEIKVIRHSLGLDYQKEPFRNHFVAGEGHSEMPILESLISKGAMVKRPDPFDEVNGNFIFHVTEDGKAAVLC